MTQDSPTYSNTILQDLTGMQFDIQGDVPYLFRFVLAVKHASSAFGIKLGLTFPSVISICGHGEVHSGSAGEDTEMITQGNINSSGDFVIGGGMAAAANTGRDFIHILQGSILCSTAGTLHVQAACEVATGAGVLVSEGSAGLLWSMV